MIKNYLLGAARQDILTKIADEYRPQQFTEFLKMIVIDIVIDANLIDEAKYDYYEGLGTQNISIIKFAPRNSIIARILNTESTNQDTSRNSYILAPFLSNHLVLPTKPGEVIWAFFDKTDRRSNFGYWISKVTDINLIDDQNYTHFPRKYDLSNNTITEVDKNNGKETKYVFTHKAIVPAIDEDLNDINDDDENQGFKNIITDISGSRSPYEFLLTKTLASQLINYEAIPRFRKRPADVAIEGSNNTLICLGTERFGEYINFSEAKNGNIILPENQKSTGKGAIDIVVGRGNSLFTSGSKVQNKVESNSGLYVDFSEEIKKGPTNETHQYIDGRLELEGDPDFRTDSARIFLSQKSNPNLSLDLIKNRNGGTFFDQNKSGITTYNQNILNQQNNLETGCIIQQSDNIRIIGRNNLQLMIRTGDIDSNDSPDLYSSITIREDGNIVISPAKGKTVLFTDDVQNQSKTTITNEQVNEGANLGLNVESAVLGNSVLKKINDIENKINQIINTLSQCAKAGPISLPVGPGPAAAGPLAPVISPSQIQLTDKTEILTDIINLIKT